MLLGHGPAVLRAERAKSVFLSGIAAALSCPAAAARAARSGHRLPGHDRSRQLKKNFRRGWFWLIQTSLAASDSPGPSPKQKGGTLVDCSTRVKDRRSLLLLAPERQGWGGAGPAGGGVAGWRAFLT